MGRIRVSTVIDASPRRVWAEIADIARHVEWMDDAVSIRFTSGRRTGVGTSFECDTRVGPLRLTDRMAVTEWSPGKAIGIGHIGLVTGTGRLSIRRTPKGRTRFTWAERLHYPWWMGGPAAGVVADVVLRRVWRHNLANLKRLVEG